jgi:hypothetical protein
MALSPRVCFVGSFMFDLEGHFHIVPKIVLIKSIVKRIRTNKLFNSKSCLDAQFFLGVKKTGSYKPPSNHLKSG